ncbi:MAG: OB-fold nucleic acid binding domain-containing protein [Nannocystaceae bacterium]
MTEHKISLRGPAARGTGVAAAVLRDLLDAVLQGCQQSVRLRCEGRSSTRGQPPLWLDQAAAFDVIGIREGSTLVMIEAKPLRTAAPDHFTQIDMFDDVDSEQSALDLFLLGLEAASANDTNSDYFDAGLLRTYGRLDRIFRRGFEEIEFDGVSNLVIDTERMSTIGKLKATVPAPRQVRVAGKLEQIKHSNRRFTLLMEEGTLNGVADDSISPDQLAEQFGRVVVVSGEAVFRPGGGLLRVEAKHLEPAAEVPSIWSRIPRPLLEGPTTADKYRVAQGPRSGLAAIIGKWPGDETDEEIAAALEQIS